eukprot:GHVU01156908.1.p3 GENE.GHVU01156908.1~~GHVU01156908.1.p3  ORF type:complete len:128 (+),score=30.72 GHVU01156908.1:50-433(+)
MDMSDTAQSSTAAAAAAAAADQPGARGAPNAGTGSPIAAPLHAGEFMDALQRMEERIQVSMREMEGRITEDRVRQRDVEMLQPQQQQQGAAAANPGLPHPVDREEGEAVPGRGEAVAAEDAAAGVVS